jgi:Lon-like protease
MSAGVTTVDETAGTESESPPRRSRRFPKWPLVLAGLLLAIGIGIAAAWPINVPYYTLSPGPVYDTSDFISIPSEGPTADTGGELFFLTVALQEANIFEWAAAQVSPKVDLAPRQNIRPEGTSREELRQINLDRMEESKLDAQYVALTELGYEPTVTGSGALVAEVVEGTGAEGVLEPGDVIVAIDGRPVTIREDVTDLVEGKQIGDQVAMTVERSTGGNGQPGSTDAEGPPIGAGTETLELTIVLGPHVDDPAKPMIGILAATNDPLYDFPIDIEMDSKNIGGPSAGMMFTLEIINQLTPDYDITGGMRIAGTGTIAKDGTVGPIGGVRQKVYAAIDAGATVVFIPAANYEDALDAADGNITVIRVETIDDPLDYLGVDLAQLAA